MRRGRRRENPEPGEHPHRQARGANEKRAGQESIDQEEAELMFTLRNKKNKPS